MKRWLASLLLLGACSSSSDATRVRLELTFDDGWGLTRLELAAAGHSSQAPVAHVVTVLLPDDAAGTEVGIDVTGWRGDEEWASGHATAHPTPHGEVLAQATLTHVDSPGGPDAGSPDAGSPDAGSPDAGSPDAGAPDAAALDAGCMPRSCDEAGAECGTVSDGCTGTLVSGPCTGNTYCAADGTPNKCTVAVSYAVFGLCPFGFREIKSGCMNWDTGNTTAVICLADGISDLDYDLIYNTFSPETHYDCVAPWRDPIVGQYDCPPNSVRVCVLDE